MWVVYENPDKNIGPDYWEKKLLKLFQIPGDRFLSLLRETWLFRFLCQNIKSKGRILDLGSGSGFNAKLLFGKKLKIVGVDYAFQLVAHSARMNPSSKFVCADIRSLPFRKNSFNTVLSVSSLEHVELGLETVLDEISRVLKKGGTFVLIAPSPQWADSVLENFHLLKHSGKKVVKSLTTLVGEKKGIIESALHTTQEPGFHAYWMNHNEWIALCEKNGFRLVHYERGDLVGGLIRSKIFGQVVKDYYQKIIQNWFTEDLDENWLHHLLISEQTSSGLLNSLLDLFKIFYSYLNGMVFKR